MKNASQDDAASLAFFRRYMNQRNAWAAGKNVVLTIDEPAINANGDPYTKHKRVKAREVWGDPRKAVSVISSADRVD